MLGCPRATSTSKAYPLPLAKSLPGSPVNCSDHSRRDMATAGICANQDSCSAAPIAASSFSPSAAITLARSWRAVSGLGRLAYPNWRMGRFSRVPKTSAYRTQMRQDRRSGSAQNLGALDCKEYSAPQPRRMAPGGQPSSCASATHRRFGEPQFALQWRASSSSVGVRIPRLSRSLNRLGYPPARERTYQEGCPSGEPKLLKHKEHGSRSC